MKSVFTTKLAQLQRVTTIYPGIYAREINKNFKNFKKGIYARDMDNYNEICTSA